MADVTLYHLRINPITGNAYMADQGSSPAMPQYVLATDYEALRKRCEAVEAALRDCLKAMDVARDTIQPITQAQVKLHGLDPATANKLDAAASKALAAIAAAQEPSHG